MLGSPLVLLYHAFGRRSPQADPHNLFVPEEDFERQLRALTRMLQPLSLEDFVAGWARGRWPRGSFLLTMDDGYVSTFDVAAPLLARYRVPAVLFVPPGLLGGRTSWMPEMPGETLLDQDRLLGLREFGVALGVHGMDHRRLPGLSGPELRREVLEARHALADLAGSDPRSFAYPEGLFDAAAVRAVREAGYEVAFSVHEGGAGRYSVTRVPVNSRDSFTTFLTKLVPGFNTLYRASARHPAIRRAAAWMARQRSRPA